jgi:hypothetical protein
MLTKIAVLSGVLYFPVPCMLLGQAADPKVAERYIVESERQWAASVATGDTSTEQRILADDFIGVDPGGQLVR